MINKHLLTARQQYDIAYSVYRSYGGDKKIHDWAIDEKFQKTAFRSFLNRNTLFSGWVDYVRRDAFYYETSVKYPRLYGLPF